MKYFPSAVQRPQQSLGGLTQPGNTGCISLPSARASHIAVVQFVGLVRVNLKRVPSGEKAKSLADPGTVANLRGFDPSCSEMYKSFWFDSSICDATFTPLANNSLPSGDHTAVRPEMSPRRRGDPPGIGIDQKEPSNPCASNSDF